MVGASGDLTSEGRFTPSVSVNAPTTLGYIENNGVAPDWGHSLFSSDSIVFNENSIASVIGVVSPLTLRFVVNEP